MPSATPDGVISTEETGKTLRIMPTKILLVALAVAATTLAGCQGNDPAAPTQTASAAPSTPASNGVAALTADQILQKSRDALKQAKSFRAKGAMRDEGENTDVDLRINGADFAGTMATGAAKLEMLAVGGKRYMKPNEQFWTTVTDAKKGKTLAKAVGDRWISGADSDASFADLFSIGTVDGLLKPDGAISKGEEKVIAGVPAISLKDAGDTDTLLWIATTGEPYPVQIANTDGAAVVFSGFGEPVTDITAPPAAKVIDLNKVAGK
jgi:hypothetical protein